MYIDDDNAFILKPYVHTYRHDCPSSRAQHRHSQQHIHTSIPYACKNMYVCMYDSVAFPATCIKTYIHTQNICVCMAVYLWPSTYGCLPMAVYRWPSTDGRLPMAVYLWPSTYGCLPMAVYRWPSTYGRLPMAVYLWPSTYGRLPMAVYRWPSTDGRLPMAVYLVTQHVYIKRIDRVSAHIYKDIHTHMHSQHRGYCVLHTRSI
jgi:hypothetical protein